MESEVLGAEDPLSNCTGPSEQKVGEGRVRDAVEGRSDHVVDGIKVDIWSQILPSQEGEMQLEFLGMDGFLSDCSELNDQMGAKLAGDVKDKGGVLGGISVGGFEQASPSQGCETPLELLLTGGSLSDCAEHNECKADMSVNGSCGEVREVVEEKIDGLGGINEQLLPSQGCEMPMELLVSGGSLGNCGEDSENKVYLSVNGSCVEEVKEVVEEKNEVLGGINEQMLPSQDCEMPLELLVTGGLLCSCDADNECKADTSNEGSYGEEAREVVKEKSEIFDGTDEQTLPSQGCEMLTGGSLSSCGKDNECKVNTSINGSCWEVVEGKNDALGGINEPILPSQRVETPLESLVAGGSLSTCVKNNDYKVETSINGSSGKDVQEAVEERSDILDGIDEQILPSQGCEMPLESLIKGSLSNCAKDDECKVNLSINASCCKQIREVVEEKSDILRMINEQILPSQGCGRPLESPSNFAEQNKHKDSGVAGGPSEFVDDILAGSQNNKIRQILPSQDCKIPLEHLSVASSPTDCAEGNVQKVTAGFDGSSAETVTEVVEEKSDIFLGMKGEMCSQISPIEENMYDLRERSSSIAPDYTLEKSDSPPPCCYSGVVDNGSSEIFAEPGYSGADVLIDAFNSTDADSSGNIGGEEKVDVRWDCVSETKCPEIICLPPRRSARARKSSQKTQTANVARKGWKTANKKPHSHGIFEIFLKVVRKKRSSFCKPARASIWGSLENITQVFYHNSDLDCGQVQNQGSRKTKGGRGCGKRNKSRAVGNSQGSKVKGRASTSHIRLKVKMGKRVSQSGSKDIVPDVVDTSDPVQTMFSDNGSELCWAMGSELQKFTVGVETQLVEEIPGTGQHLTSHGNLEKEKTSPIDSALDEVHFTDKDQETIVIPDNSDRNAATNYLSISSKTEVEALEGAIDNGYLDPGTSPDSEVINLIPDGQVGARVQEDLHDVVQASSKDSVAAADVTSSNVPLLKSKKGKKKDKLFQAGNSDVEDRLPCQASQSRARVTEKQGDGWKMENGLYSSENLVSSCSGIASSNLLSFQGCSTELLPPVEDTLNLSLDGSSESQNSKKLLPSTKAKGHKLPKSSKSGRASKSRSQFLDSGRNQRRNACRQKESQQKSARKNVNEEGVCNHVCKVESHQEIAYAVENHVVDDIGEIVTAEKTVSKDMCNLDMIQNEVVRQYLPPRIAWVRCDDCYKWRRIAAALADSIEETNCKWICKDNMDKAFADCSIPQEKSNGEINAELEISDASCEEDVYDAHLTSKEFGQRRSTVTQSSSWMLIRSNLFLHRSRRTQTIDEVMVCHCKRPVEGRFGCGDECLNRMLNIECVQGTCPCGDLCSNQQFQKRGYAKLKWFKCGKKGYGLQLQQDISQGQFLIEYVGEVLDLQTYEARQKEYASRGHKHFYFMTLNGSEVIDACAKGNLGRFINHSCDPNCRTEKWMVNGEICIGLFALRDIKKGEEVTFDYNYVRVFGAAAKKCVCGSPQCRGYIGGDPLSTEVIVQGDSDEEYPEPVMVNEDGETADSFDNTISTTSSFDAAEIQSKAFSKNKLDNFKTAVQQLVVGPAISESQASLEMANSIGKLAPVQSVKVSVQTEDLMNKPITAIQQKIPMEEETTSKPLCSDQRLDWPLTRMLNKASSDSADASVSKSETPEEKQVCSKSRLVMKASRSSSSVKRGKSNSNPVNANKPPGIGNKTQVLSNKPKKLLDGSANARFEAVQEKLNELLDANGGISKRKDSSKGYLKLLLLTVASGDNGNREAIQSTRDLSMILDALLKTKSRVVLVDILNKNGLRMLHNIMKQYSREFIKIPVLRKLLKVLEYLALRGILTLEHINGGPPCPGMESFRDSMLTLTEHNDKQVHQIARSFRDRWIPRPVRKISCMDRDDGRMEFHRGSNCSRFSSQHNYWREQVGRPTEAIDCVKQSMLVTTPVDACVQEESSAPGFGGSVTNGTNTRKRKSRWDQPIEAHPDPRFHPHKEQKVQPNLLQSFGSIPQPGISEMVLDHTNGISRMDKDCPGFVHNHPQQDQAEEEEDERQNLHEDVPPGFAYPLNTPLFSSNASSASADLAQQTVSHSNSTFEVAGGYPQKRFNSCLPVSYGIPLSIVQQFGTPQGETMQSWVVAPGMPFHPFPPLPPYPRDRRDPPSQTVNPITRNQPGEEQQNCHGSASCHTDQSTPSTSGASPPDVNVPCANNQHVFKRVKNNSYDLGRKYFRQQKWNNSKVRSPWHRKWNSWGFMANNARNGVCSIGIGNLANEPKGPYCSEDVSNRVENAGNTSYQHPQHQNQH